MLMFDKRCVLSWGPAALMLDGHNLEVVEVFSNSLQRPALRLFFVLFTLDLLSQIRLQISQVT